MRKAAEETVWVGKAGAGNSEGVHHAHLALSENGPRQGKAEKGAQGRGSLYPCGVTHPGYQGYPPGSVPARFPLEPPRIPGIPGLPGRPGHTRDTPISPAREAEVGNPSLSGDTCTDLAVEHEAPGAADSPAAGQRTAERCAARQLLQDEQQWLCNRGEVRHRLLGAGNQVRLEEVPRAAHQCCARLRGFPVRSS